VTTQLGPAVVAQLGFVAGLALCRALDRCCPGCIAARSAPDEARSGSDRFSLKWPNDVLGDGGKLSGILLQTEQSGPGRAVVIGIGVNVVAAPQGLPYPATSLKDLGCDVGSEALFSALAAETAEACAVWDEGRSFDAIRKLWLARAAGLGGAVAVRTGEGVARGVFETIDEHGQLVVRIGDGSTRRISAGEVHFGMTATIRDGVNREAAS
jgi:BirA family biotin operon repressor/biotin-[acetyl-CoA-carboxylase] ligase